MMTRENVLLNFEFPFTRDSIHISSLCFQQFGFKTRCTIDYNAQFVIKFTCFKLTKQYEKGGILWGVLSACIVFHKDNV
jgi:hypothetical protein